MTKSTGDSQSLGDDRNDDLSIRDAGAGRTFFTLLPNVVLTLRLSPFALALYVHLKRVTGDGGACFKKTSTLVEETGISAGSISAAKKELARPRPELGGKPLIVVEERRRPQGGKPLHYITLTDIWPENFAAFARPDAISPHEIASSRPEQAISPDEIKKIPPDQKPPDQDHTHARTRAREADAPSATPPARCVSAFSRQFRERYAPIFNLGIGWLRRSDSGEFDGDIRRGLRERSLYDTAAAWCTEADAEILAAEVAQSGAIAPNDSPGIVGTHTFDCPGGCEGTTWLYPHGPSGGVLRCTRRPLTAKEGQVTATAVVVAHARASSVVPWPGPRP